MALSVYEIPLTGQAQTFLITLLNVQYQMTFQYRSNEQGGWVLDIADSASNPIIAGIPLVTGVDLLAQYKHLGIGGSLIVTTDADPDAVPTFDNLGTASHLYFAVEA